MLNIMIIFSIIGGIDKIFNNRLGLGEKFDEGFLGLGGLALTVIGIYSLSPLVGNILSPVLLPLARVTNTDPSVFISSILGPDLGGYPMSIALGLNQDIAKFNGMILSSMLGTLISFTIPVAVGIISREDFRFFAKGALAGIITIPIGMLAGGIVMGIPLRLALWNLLPVLFFSGLIILGLKKSLDGMIEVFRKMGSFIIKISTLGLIFAIINFIYGKDIIKNVIPIEEGAILIVNIAIILSGAFTMFEVVFRVLTRHLTKLENIFKLDKYSILGLFSSMANCIPSFGIYDKMNDKGKMINAAFSVSGAFILGGQLAYVSANTEELLGVFIISKAIASLTAIILASYMYKKENLGEG